MKNYLDVRINNTDFISNKCEHLHSGFKNQLCKKSIKVVGFLYSLINKNLGFYFITSSLKISHMVWL